MAHNPRQTRLDNEWALLAELARANPGSLDDLSRSRDAEADFFRLTLHRTTALTGAPPHLQPRRCPRHRIPFSRLVPGRAHRSFSRRARLPPQRPSR